MVSYFTNVLSYTMLCGVITSLCAGLMYDKGKGKYSSEDILWIVCITKQLT
ncbi:hypothetical protein CHS0354_011559 [Potamilus streckersoni]|uniref:Uncharacterized protein n=1 Tax=Potamilus streckersoni TaxID=2493646 RepID=A0AAE0RRE1_9BIVA|nr:hypothetical protein CHS0354_011559 [Potamilus streckersoni]